MIGGYRRHTTTALRMPSSGLPEFPREDPRAFWAGRELSSLLGMLAATTQCPESHPLSTFFKRLSSGQDSFPVSNRSIILKGNHISSQLPEQPNCAEELSDSPTFSDLGMAFTTHFRREAGSPWLHTRSQFSFGGRALTSWTPGFSISGLLAGPTLTAQKGNYRRTLLSGMLWASTTVIGTTQWGPFGRQSDASLCGREAGKENEGGIIYIL